MSEVVLNVYDLHPQNESLYHLGMGFYHSGVVINGQEWTFASGAGVYAMSPKSVPHHRESIPLGRFRGTMRDVDTILDSLRPAYHGGNYHILNRNCNSFSESFVLKLLNREIPGYVNRMAFWGSLFSCLLPQDMTGQAPVGDTAGGGDTTHNGGSSGGFTLLQPASRRSAPTSRTSSSASATTNPMRVGRGGQKLGGGECSDGDGNDDGTASVGANGAEARRAQMLAAASRRLDLQGLFPGFYEGTPLAGLLDWYVATYNDILMEGARSGDMPWFKSFLFCEALFQLPFFFYASVALAQKINSVRVPMIIYGSHVATTVLAILTEFAYSPALTQEQRLTLFGFYLPYLLVPVALVLDFSRHPVPFGGTKRA